VIPRAKASNVTRAALLPLLLLAAPLTVRAQPPISPTVLENAYVTVTRGAAPCASASKAGCGDRVIVAMADVEVRSAGSRRALTRGGVAVFKAGEAYEPPTGGEYYEVAFKPDHPAVQSPPGELIPPDQNVILYDGPRFLVFEEKLPVGGYRARHGHSQRVVVQLNATRLQQHPDGQPEVTRDIVPNRPAFNEAVVHDTRNVGQLPLHGIVIELKPEARARPR
jgi:hypothetical protein